MSLGPSDVVFAEATPAQQKLAWELNGASWAAPLSLADYVARETYLSQQPLCRDGGTRYWVLHLASDPAVILSGCETTRKSILVTRPGSAPRRAHAYAIASVYTNPAYRRRGLASLMLARVQDFMDADGAAVSVLYSDIGKLYYAKLGWPAFPSDQATLHLLPGRDAPPPVPSGPATTHYLGTDDLPPLCAADVARQEARFRGAGGDPPPPLPRVAFAPTFEQVAWQLARSEFMARALFRRVPERRGAATADGAAWACWDHDWRERKLKVMRLVAAQDTAAERVAALRALLQAAAAEAAEWELEKVLVWSPCGEVVTACKAVADAHPGSVRLVLDERTDGSIPSLRWKDGEEVRDAVWDDNEYYCWC